MLGRFYVSLSRNDHHVLAQDSLCKILLLQDRNSVLLNILRSISIRPPEDPNEIKQKTIPNYYHCLNKDKSQN